MTTTQQTPASAGFSMPAEWGRHEATWLCWPQYQNDWPDKIGAVEWVYGEMVRKISPGETVRILVNSKAVEAKACRVLARAGVDLSRVELLRWPTNRGWMRDSGPIFVRRGGPGRETAVIHFHFNAWAKYPDWKRDRVLPVRASRKLRMRLLHARFKGRDFIFEGGGIDVNGRGSLLATEQSLLDPVTQVRNPGLGRKDVEQVFRDSLGVKNVLWLGDGIAGDDTHGHVDDLCRFVNPRTVVLASEKNRRDVNYRALADNRERVKSMRLEDGSRLDVVLLPMPAPLFYDGRRLPASYANFYIGNAAVIVPTFNDPNDRIALGILSELFRDRPVVGIHAVDVVLGRGTLHCLTQQQPA